MMRLRNNRAAVLILTLWIVVILSTIYYSLVEELTLDTKLTILQAKDMKAFYGARVGVSRAVVDLMNDLIIDMADEARAYDGLGDVWAQDEELIGVSVLDRRRHDTQDRLYYSVLVQDEESKININRCNYPALYGLFRVLGMEDQQAQDVAYAVIDWRDPDSKPSNPNASMDMNESDYYRTRSTEGGGLRAKAGQSIYLCKNDAFTSLEELLDIYGITSDLFYYGAANQASRMSRGRSSRSRSRGASGRGKRNLASLERPDGTDMSDNQGLRDFLTIWSSGRINVNTAPAEVLAAIAVAEGRSVDEARTWAQDLVSRRGQQGRGNNDAAFRSPVEFQQQARFSARPQKAGIRGMDVKSTTFRITAIGELRVGREETGVTHSVQAIVERVADRFPKSPVVDDPSGISGQEPLDPPLYEVMRETQRDGNTVYDPAVRIRQWIEW